MRRRLRPDIILLDIHENAAEVELKQPQSGGLANQRPDSGPKEGSR
jgi:hypothetical protein